MVSTKLNATSLNKGQDHWRTSSTLTLNPVTSDHDGVYKCSADFGESEIQSAPASIVVEGKKVSKTISNKCIVFWSGSFYLRFSPIYSLLKNRDY